MRSLALGAVVAVVALTSFAGSCVVRNISVTTIGPNKVGAGELRNESGADLLQHNISVAFFDSGNQLVSLQTVPGCLRSLQDGTSDFFSAATDQPAVSMLSRISFDGDLRVGAVVDGDFTISGVTAVRKGGSLTVKGSVKNNSDHTVTAPHACAVVFDNGGHVVVTASDSSINDLSQDEQDGFSIVFDVPDSATLSDHVDVWLDALDGGVPIEPQSATGNAIAVCPGTATPTATPGTTTPSATAAATETGTATASSTSTATASPISTPAGC